MANAYEVESMEILACDEDLYNEACRADSVVAQSLSIPTDRRYATLVVEGLGSEVIGKVEKLSAVRHCNSFLTLSSLNYSSRMYGIVKNMDSNIKASNRRYKFFSRERPRLGDRTWQ